MDRRRHGKSTVMGYLDFYNLSDADKLEIFTSVAYTTGLPAFVIEKDWWVVRTLEAVFQTQIAPHTVFKGGTSLSKAWQLISRFSEDIDLALDKKFLGFSDELKSKKAVNKLRRASFTFISETFLPEVQNQFVQNGLEIEIRQREVFTSDQDPLILEIYYPFIVDPSNYMEPRVLVELGSRSQRVPFTIRQIKSIISETLEDVRFADDAIEVPSVNPERTFLEKLFLLHEEFQRPKEKIRVDRLSRHLYDIHQISKTDHASRAIEDRELFKSIVEHRKIYTYLSGVDYTSHYPPNLNPIPPDGIIETWAKDYSVMRTEMIHGDSLDFDQLLVEIEALLERINDVSWL